MTYHTKGDTGDSPPPQVPLGAPKTKSRRKLPEMGVSIVRVYGGKNVQNITEKTVCTKYEENR